MIGTRFICALIAGGVVAVIGESRGFSEDTRKYLALAAMTVAFILPIFVFAAGAIWAMAFFEKNYGAELREAWNTAWHPPKEDSVDVPLIEDNREAELLAEQREEEKRQHQWEAVQRRIADSDFPRDVIEDQLHWEHERIFGGPR